MKKLLKNSVAVWLAVAMLSGHTAFSSKKQGSNSKKYDDARSS